jgi:MYXO-CTERM domain-containing protein
MPLDLIPARSSTLTDLAIVAGFAVIALAGAVAVCRRRA